MHEELGSVRADDASLRDKLVELESQLSDTDEAAACLRRELSAVRAQVSDGERARERLQEANDAGRSEMEALLADAEQQRASLKVSVLVFFLGGALLAEIPPADD